MILTETSRSETENFVLISVPFGVFSPTLKVYSFSENIGTLSLTSLKKMVTGTVENEDEF